MISVCRDSYLTLHNPTLASLSLILGLAGVLMGGATLGRRERCP
jgi:hypothetical protein